MKVQILIFSERLNNLIVFFRQEKKYRLQNKIDDLKKKGKEMIGGIDDVKSDIIKKWEEKSREFIDSFIMLFGPDGRVRQYLTGKKVMQAISPPTLPKLDRYTVDLSR